MSASKSHGSSVPVADMDANEKTMCVYDDASMDSAVNGLQVLSRLSFQDNNYSR